DAAPVAAEPAAPSSAEPLGARFWAFAVIWAIFSLGNSSDSFIFLRSFDIDAQLMLVPLFYAGFNIAYALAATPLGSLSDVLGRLPLLLFSLVVFGFTYLGWSVASQPWHIAELFVMYGLYYAGTEGVARAFVADLVPKGRRGAALGWFTALSGLATLPANLMAAYLWNNVGKQAPFVYGAGLAFGAALLLLIGYRWLRGPRVEPAP
ncbi:MAG TPA: MFS transporter, partial [Kouleothrix sp.]|nr:MFS transporter [Kouleothrix sp.]